MDRFKQIKAKEFYMVTPVEVEWLIKEIERYQSNQQQETLRLIKCKDEQITFLWRLLDDISTAGDICRPEDSSYVKYVDQKCNERNLVANSKDGYTLTIVEYDD